MKLSIKIASFTCLLCIPVFVHPVQSLCENDSSFRYSNRAKFTCKYIRNNEERRQDLCQNAEVRNACKQACGSCCEDSFTYVLTTDIGTDQNCEWLSKKSSRKERYCERYINHKMVRDAWWVARFGNISSAMYVSHWNIYLTFYKSLRLRWV